MLARVFSCAVVGLAGVVIEVEVDDTNRLPGVTSITLSLWAAYTGVLTA